MPSEPPPLQAGPVALQLAIVLALVLLNGFFVASEFALVSVRRTRIDQLATEGSQAAKTVQHTLRDLDRYIAATQVGITIASLLLGGIGERTLEPLIDALFQLIQLPEVFLGITRTGVALFLTYFFMTSMHVVVGELMPKSIALQKAEATSLLIARPMMWAARLFFPLIWLLNGTGNFLLRCIGFHVSDGHMTVHSPEELDLLFTQSHEGGQLTQTEREILHRVVKFSDLTAREVMVPRVEMKALPLQMPRRQLTDWLQQRPPSRAPIFHESLDEIVGVAHLKDLLAYEATLRRQPETTLINLASQAREALRVPETITIDKLLLEFQKARQKMAIVIDEYGGTAGLITMGDLIEQVIGDVHDEFDRIEPEFVERGPGAIEVGGRVLIDEINERFGTGFRSDDADTIAGLVLNELGRPAEIGDEVTIGEVRLRVEALDRLRITKILLLFPPDANINTAETEEG